MVGAGLALHLVALGLTDFEWPDVAALHDFLSSVGVGAPFPTTCRREPAVIDPHAAGPVPFDLSPGRHPVLHRHQLLGPASQRSEEHTSELQSLMRISSAVFCMKKKKT